MVNPIVKPIMNHPHITVFFHPFASPDYSPRSSDPTQASFLMQRKPRPLSDSNKTGFETGLGYGKNGKVKTIRQYHDVPN